MREEIEGLEDDAHASANLVEIGSERGHIDIALEPDGSRIDGLKAIDAAQQRRLARAGGSDQHDDLMCSNIQFNRPQDSSPAEGLPHLLHSQHRRGLVGHAVDPRVRRRRIRS